MSSGTLGRPGRTSVACHCFTQMLSLTNSTVPQRAQAFPNNDEHSSRRPHFHHRLDTCHPITIHKSRRKLQPPRHSRCPNVRRSRPLQSAPSAIEPRGPQISLLILCSESTTTSLFLERYPARLSAVLFWHGFRRRFLDLRVRWALLRPRLRFKFFVSLTMSSTYFSADYTQYVWYWLV